MRKLGLTFKPLAQWSRHSLMISWSFCLMAVMFIVLHHGLDASHAESEISTPILLLLQSLAILPVIGVLHCMFMDPHASLVARAAQRSKLLSIVVPLTIVLATATPFLPIFYARLLASVIVVLLSVTLISRSIALLRQHVSLEAKLAVFAASLCALVHIISFTQVQWQLRTLPSPWPGVMAAIAVMTWVAALFLQAAHREQKLRASLDQFDHAARALHRIYNTSPVALMSLDGDFRIQRWNQRAAEAFGGDLGKQPAPHIFALLGEEVGHKLLADLKKAGMHHSELALHRGGVDKVWVLEASLRDGGGCEIGMHEVTAHARRAATFQEIAEHDTLTGLPNLVGLRRLISKQLMQTRSSSPLSCIYVDILQFNDINRVFGRHAGDAVLRAFSQQLLKLLPPPAMVGRIRDDHFLVILPGSELTLTRSTAGMLLDSLTRTPIEYQGLSISMEVSIGAVESVANISADRLIESAQLACELSRTEGAPRPYAVMADSPALATSDLQLNIGKDFRAALPELPLTLYGQAITSLKQDVAVQSITVLPRQLNESGQPMVPTALLAAAAHQGASAALDRLLLGRVLQMLHTQPWSLPANGVLIYRLSPLSLAEPGFTGNLIRMLGSQSDNRSMTINNRLCIELPLQTLDYDPEGSLAFLKDLRLMSVQTAIDLSEAEGNTVPVRHLAQLPIRHVRLDGRLFSDLGTSSAAHKEITAIRALYDTLNIQCLVDHVNNPLDLRPLGELGIDLVQGRAVSAVRPLEHILVGREEESLLPTTPVPGAGANAATLIPV